MINLCTCSISFYICFISLYLSRNLYFSFRFSNLLAYSYVILIVSLPPLFTILLFSSFKFILKKIILILERNKEGEREEERDRGREKDWDLLFHLFAFIGWFMYMVNQDQNHNLCVSGWCSNLLSYSAFA